ncbi:hypothetical protein IEQ34_000380 [Dendrobium chrysotoxum]|uniref:HP domain-containing protein n=1 Tax=Dendrobium chrysotoxum TaxID=161865 RepID=A0AAV7HSL1_DENCH|nr:hypothetical protein IEQ34_000380 [Dendrobium chrysotoxum]
MQRREQRALLFGLLLEENKVSPAIKLQQILLEIPICTRSPSTRVTEVFNFVQDDLLSEDMLILDTHSEVFIWIGQCVETKDKQKAFDIGQKYIELAMCLEGLASDVPLYKVTEGNEPCFFTAYFSWDSAKAASKDKSNNASQSGPTQRASALAALSSAFNPHSKSKPTNPSPVRSTKGSSQRAAAVAALSSVLTAEQKKAQVEGSTRRFGRNSPPDSNATGSFKEETASSVVWDPAEDSAEKEGIESDGSVSQSNDVNLEENQDTIAEENADENTYSYERLKAKSRKPVTGIDYKRREAYLSDEEFQTVFGMTKQSFYQQPKWKQDMQKRKFDLF